MNTKILTTAQKLPHSLFNSYSFLGCVALYCYPYDTSGLSYAVVLCLILNALRTQKIYYYHLYQSQLRSTLPLLACAVQFALLWTPICLALLNTSYFRLDCLSCSCFGLLLCSIIHEQLTHHPNNQSQRNQAFIPYIQSTCGLLGSAIIYLARTTQSPLGLLLAGSIMYLSHKSTKEHTKEHSNKTTHKQHTYAHIMWLSLQISWLLNTLSQPYLALGLLLGMHSFIANQQPPTTHSRTCWLYVNNALVIALLIGSNLTTPTSYIGIATLTILLVRLGSIYAELTIDSYQHLPNTNQTQLICHSISVISIMCSIYLHQNISPLLCGLGMLTLALGLSYHHQRAANLEPVFLISSHFLKDIFRTLFGVRIHGQHPEPTTQPTLVIANHTCLLDVPLIAALFPEKLVYPIFPTWMQFWAIRAMGTIFADIYPMKPTSPHSMLQVVKTIKTGKRCLIFPEGRLSNTGNLMKLYDGAAFICEHTKAQLQPIIIAGGMNHISSRTDGRSIKQLLPKITIGISERRSIDCGELSSKDKKPFIIRQMYQALTDTQLQMQPKQHIYDLIYQASKTYNHGQNMLRDHNWIHVYTYTTLLAKAHSISKGLAHLPLGSIVALHMPSESALALHMLGCFFAGHCALPIDPNRPVAQKQAILKRYPIALCIHQDADATLDTTLTEQNIPQSNQQDIPKSTYFWDNPNKIQDPEHSPALIFAYPNGKDIVLTQHNIVTHAQQLNIHSNTLGHDCVYNQIGLHEPLGFHMGLMLPLISGIPTTLTGNDKQANAHIESIYDTQSSIIIAKRNLFDDAKDVIYNHQDVEKVRTIFYPGPSITPDLAKHWIHHCKANLYSVYCPDDAGCIIAMHHPTYQQHQGYGQLLSGMHYGDELEYQQGPIASGAHFSKVTGPQLSKYYYNPTLKQIQPKAHTNYQFHKPIQMCATGFIYETV